MGWVGIRDKYFCEVLVPGEPGIEGFKVEPEGDARLVWATTTSLNSVGVRVYLGPQDEKALKEFDVGANQIVSYGKFDVVAKPILLLLKAIQRVVKNWGVAIILMTIIVYSLLSPLSLKSMRSMRRMQALQPQVEALKVKYKDNPQKMHAEVMELYKREKVNPMGGCLPMLLQIPVFFSLYQVLMRSVDLKGQGFLWIKDLSEPDRLFVFGNSLPVIGNEFNLLPVLMAGLMVLQQKITMKSSGTASPEMAQQQKIMGTVMPAVFGVLFYRISSGLVLYWFVNSLLSVLFQWKVNKSENGSK
jgi:YidC/Oxa1 family membrane protein insertase